MKKLVVICIIILFASVCFGCESYKPLYEYSTIKEKQGEIFDTNYLDYMNRNSFIDLDSDIALKINKSTFKKIDQNRAEEIRNIVKSMISDLYNIKFAHMDSSKDTISVFTDGLSTKLNDQHYFDSRDKIIQAFELSTIIPSADIISGDFAKEYIDEQTHETFYLVYAKLTVTLNANDKAFYKEFPTVAYGDNQIEIWPCIICENDDVNTLKIIGWTEVIRGKDDKTTKSVFYSEE